MFQYNYVTLSSNPSTSDQLCLKTVDRWYCDKNVKLSCPHQPYSPWSILFLHTLTFLIPNLKRKFNLIMAALCNRAGHYIFVLWILSSSFFLLSFFPRLISAVADCMFTILLNMVWQCEFRMQVWNALHAARWKCRTQKIAQNLSSGHHRTTLSGYIFTTKAYIYKRKKLVKQQCLPHMSSQYDELWPTSGWDLLVSLRHPCKFQRVLRLAALLHSTLVVGVSQTLRCWIASAIYIWQGGHHVGHWPTFLVSDKNAHSWNYK